MLDDITPLDARLLGEARETRERLIDLQRDVERARVDYQRAIRRLHAAGGSLREISENLGLSHQRVHQIVESEAGETTGRERRSLRPRGRRRPKWPFERFTRLARQVVLVAEEEARALDHNYLGTEHILLGLLALEDGLAARALNSLGISLDDARASAVGVIGRGTKPVEGELRFTPRAKKVLDLALREARALKHNYIVTEHILLGLVREDEGVAAKLLLEAGADAETVRGAVLAMLANRD